MKNQKILVANRSEIACRVFQTAREMGITTIGIYAPGDEEARHLSYADEIYSVAGYLNIESIIEVAKKSGATLIHPGYGFLSERPAFARAVEKAGIRFLGPTAETMEIMGGKIDAKEAAIKANVPTLPWAKIKDVNPEEVKKLADQMGYPVLLKAAAGGGGKGMRRVDNASELVEAAESASSEAITSFGDGTLFMEKLVLHPRHIEVQVFGDGKGGGIHLFERECTLQRRHQKVWEEATAPHLSDETKKGLFEASLSLVRNTKYRSAGTLEFLVDEDGKFYFLEMNTRLQVEHPVTEQVTGTDLVRAQIELGLYPDQFPFKQPLFARGHSIEVRLYAEDPSQGFMPTPGKIDRLRWPSGTGIRVESGVEEGQTIGTSFDSMLGKIIVTAPDRTQAIARMRFALDETVILGMGSNQSYLRTLCDDENVIAGKVHTHYLEEKYADFSPTPSEEECFLLQQLREKMSFSTDLSLEEGSVHSTWTSPWKN